MPLCCRFSTDERESDFLPLKPISFNSFVLLMCIVQLAGDDWSLYRAWTS
jgi:hypothetical protein